MNGWWCSTQRRTELLRYAMANGYNKIALGHHMDDILETLLMNMIGRGELATMPPRLKYDKYPITIIRPLCFVTEARLIEHAKAGGYSGFTCTCNYLTIRIILDEKQREQNLKPSQMETRQRKSGF